MSTFGEMLKRDRERIKLSQEALAERLGVSQQAVANWEANTSLPRGSRRVELLEVLGPDSELARNPPQQEFISGSVELRRKRVIFPTAQTTSPGERLAAATAGALDLELPPGGATASESQNRTFEEWKVAREKEQAELRGSFPAELLRYVEGSTQVGATERRLDYLSPSVAAEIETVRTARFFHRTRFDSLLLRLAVVRSIEQTATKRQYMLIIVVPDMAELPIQRGVQSLMFDAHVLGIAVHLVRSMAEAAALIVNAEAGTNSGEEPPFDIEDGA